MIIFLIKLVLGAIGVAIAAGFFRSWQMNRSAQQTEFLKHGAPATPPDGFYKGTALGPHTTWKGKEFSAHGQSGINIFDTGNGTTAPRYPFKTSVGPGITDRAITTLKIDYNVPSNPFWVRPILDEVVEIETGYYLGKLRLRIIPGFPFTLIFFELNR